MHREHERCAIRHRHLHAETFLADGREDRHRPRDRDLEPAGHQLRNRLLERLRDQYGGHAHGIPRDRLGVHRMERLRRSERIHMHRRHERGAIGERWLPRCSVPMRVAAARRIIQPDRERVMTHVRAEIVVERPGDYWRQEEMAHAYDRGRFDSLWGRIYRWREERTIVQALHDVPRGGTVLDAACGTGRITAL